MSPATSEPTLLETLTIPYGFKSPLVGIVLPTVAVLWSDPIKEWSKASADPVEARANARTATRTESALVRAPSLHASGAQSAIGCLLAPTVIVGRPGAWVDVTLPPLFRW